jgi:hypothetical protein
MIVLFFTCAGTNNKTLAAGLVRSGSAASQPFSLDLNSNLPTAATSSQAYKHSLLGVSLLPFHRDSNSNAREAVSEAEAVSGGGGVLRMGSGAALAASYPESAISFSSLTEGTPSASLGQSSKDPAVPIKKRKIMLL